MILKYGSANGREVLKKKTVSEAGEKQLSSLACSKSCVSSRQKEDGKTFAIVRAGISRGVEDRFSNFLYTFENFSVSWADIEDYVREYDVEKTLKTSLSDC